MSIRKTKPRKEVLTQHSGLALCKDQMSKRYKTQSHSLKRYFRKDTGDILTTDTKIY